VKSVVNFNRETDPMGKVTLNVQILESIHLECTQFIFGGFQIDPLENNEKRLTLLFSASSAANIEVAL
jgi:hypothetical protein